MGDLSEVFHVDSAISVSREEDFFEAKEDSLCRFCASVAKRHNAENAAIFFVTETESDAQVAVMRGASGRLRETFEKNKKKSDQHASYGENVSGYAYLKRSLRQSDMPKTIANWPMTNQIWQLAQGRIANTNRAMDALCLRTGRTGKGDRWAYPGFDLATTFRNMVGIPIFAQGGKTELPFVAARDDDQSQYPSSASSQTEFFSTHRVIGIIKLENKQPERQVDAAEQKIRNILLHRVEEAKQKHEGEHIGPPSEDSSEFLKKMRLQAEAVGEWCAGLPDDFNRIVKKKFPRVLRAYNSKTDQWDSTALEFCKLIADAVTEVFHAMFSREDRDALALQGMEAGRLLARRTVAYASESGLLIGENEVGMLNVRWQDVRDLQALRIAAEVAVDEMNALLTQLREDLRFDSARALFDSGVSEDLPRRTPIRDVAVRTKDSDSLLQKLMRKQQYLERNTDAWELHTTQLTGLIQDFGPLSGNRLQLRGKMTVESESPQVGSTRLEMKARLGMRGTPQLTVKQANVPAALVHSPRRIDPDRRLVHRILSNDCYAIDDLAGIRVITDFESDVDLVIEELKARCNESGIRLVKVDDLRDQDKQGYQAVHLTFEIRMDNRLDTVTSKTLCSALDRTDFWIPIEVQVRTLLQDSWAKQTHSESYKRGDLIPDELKETAEIHARILHQADWLRDNLHAGIEERLLPDDYGERRLNRYLRPRLAESDFAAFRFGLACANHLLRDRLRYNGQPEFSMSVEICSKLVEQFGVLDSDMLLVPLLRSVWLHSARALMSPNDRESISASGLVDEMCRILKRDCIETLADFRLRLAATDTQQGLSHRQDILHGTPGEWLRIWLKERPAWFWEVQRSFRDSAAAHAGDGRHERWKRRLHGVYGRLHARFSEGGLESLESSLEKTYVVEAAVLVGNLFEIPSEPGRNRRVRLYNEYLDLFEEIRRFLPNGPTKKSVLEVLDRSFRQINGTLV